MSRKYRVGFIGVGSVTTYFMDGWQAVPDRAEVTALCDIVPAQMAKRKETHPETCGKAREYTDYREMLEKEELICSMTDGAKTTELLHALWLSDRMQIKVPVLPTNHTG